MIPASLLITISVLFIQVSMTTITTSPLLSISAGLMAGIMMMVSGVMIRDEVR